MVVVEGQSSQESLRKLENVRDSWKKDEHVPDFLPRKFEKVRERSIECN